MSEEIRLVYVATRALADPSRANTDQTLIINANNNDPPANTLVGTTQFSRRRTRKATTVHGKYRSGVIDTPWIDGADRVYWREFFESTEEEEPFRLLHSDYFGYDTDVSDLNVFRPLNSGRLIRFQLANEYRASIRWEQINH